jgi:hypothetical protein
MSSLNDPSSGSGQREVDENNPRLIHEIVSRCKQVAIVDSTHDTHEEVTSREATQPLRFVDEQELWQPDNKGVRKAIRAHVRKDTHLKQERRKDVLRARSYSGLRPLLIKQPQDSQTTPPALPSHGVIRTAGNSSRSRREILRRQYKVQREVPERGSSEQGLLSKRSSQSYSPSNDNNSSEIITEINRLPNINIRQISNCKYLAYSSKQRPYNS